MSHYLKIGLRFYNAVFGKKKLPNLFYHTAQEFLKSDQINCLNFEISRRPNTQILCFSTSQSLF